jgi:hypothetical protein
MVCHGAIRFCAAGTAMKSRNALLRIFNQCDFVIACLPLVCEIQKGPPAKKMAELYLSNEK